MPAFTAQRRGFTLIEMLIVGALIVLFAGLAMIGAQQMYDQNKRKAVMDEVKSIGTTLSAARQDVGFYPRIYMLGLPLDQLRFVVAATARSATPIYYVKPGLDTLGFYTSGAPGNPPQFPAGNPLFQMTHFWKAPYWRLNEGRKASGSGGRKLGLVKVRLSDAEINRFYRNVNGEDLSLVDWPTDAWGNPYAVYHISFDPAYKNQQTNPKGLRLINSPMEEATYCNAVVSYGANHVPGGKDVDQPGAAGPNHDYYGFPNESMFVTGDLGGGNADYTLKSVNSMWPQALLQRTPQTAATLALSLEMNKANNPNGYIGIFDDGSDDLFFKF